MNFHDEANVIAMKLNAVGWVPIRDAIEDLARRAFEAGKGEGAPAAEREERLRTANLEIHRVNVLLTEAERARDDAGQILAAFDNARAADRTVVDLARDVVARAKATEEAIRTHRAQKADDRCIEDDDRLYAALGDGIKCDRRVGDRAAMLQNCARFIEQRCDGGGWASYAELEAKLAATAARVQRETLEKAVFDICLYCKDLGAPIGPRASGNWVHDLRFGDQACAASVIHRRLATLPGSEP